MKNFVQHGDMVTITASAAIKSGDLVRVTYYDMYGYRSRTGILDEVLPAFKLLKLRDIAIDFDDIQGIELRGRA